MKTGVKNTMNLSKILDQSNIKNCFILFLYILAFFLPLSEAAKQISIVFLLLSGFIYIFKYKKGFKQKDYILYFGIGYILASSVSILFAFDKIEAFHGMLDVFKIISIFLIIREMKFEKKVIINFALILFFSFLITYIWAEYDLIKGITLRLKLNSIGHFNHTAIYIGIISIISLALFTAKESFTKNYRFIKIFSAVIFLISLYAIFVAASRAIMFSIPFIALMILYNSGSLGKKDLLIVVLSALVIVVAIYFNHYTLQKIYEGMNHSYRLQLWQASIDAWLHHNIFFGIGNGNSHFIDPRVYVPNTPFRQITHSHNTFITILLEKGIFGLISYSLFILFVLISLIKEFKKDKQNYITVIALAVYLLNILVSAVNTTFHDENGLLTGILWAIALQKKD